MKKLLDKLKHQSKKRKLVMLVVGVLLIVAAGLLIMVYKNNKKPASEPENITYSTDTPDESKANADNYNWHGGPNDPRKIRIQKIGVDAYVQRASVDQNNKVAVPNNVHLAGWFVNSQQPGQNGLAIIAGHVTGKTTDGVFKNIGKMDAGDEFEVELGSGEVKRYKVIETQQVKESESANILFSQNPKVKSQVNLITCGGSFNKSTNQYDDRIIVSGELQT